MKLNRRPLGLLLVLLLVVEGGNGQMSLSFLSSLFDIPLTIYNLLLRDAEAFQGLLLGQEPTSTFKLVTAEGFGCDTHDVVTQDGYILDLFRISHRRRPSLLLSPLIQNHTANSTNTNNNPQRSTISKPAVILLHGIAQSSDAWVVNSPKDDALGFYLADRGYDVWLCNHRGTPYSTRHVSLHPSSPPFWEYSNHEVGVFDLAATIDYVLNVTKQERLNFVGFSTANAAFLILQAKKPEYNKKVGVAVFLAPAGIYYDAAPLSNTRQGKMKIGAPLLLKALHGMGDLLRNVSSVAPVATRLMHWLLPVLCSRGLDWFALCLSTLRSHVGHDQGLISQAKLASALATFPNPVPVRTLTHMAQQMSSGQFAEFDFGEDGNRKLYGGSKFPPAYNLSRVQVPIAILVGAEDLIGRESEATRLAGQLPVVVGVEKVSNPSFTHASFHLATGAAKLVHNRVLQLLQKFP